MERKKKKTMATAPVIPYILMNKLNVPARLIQHSCHLTPAMDFGVRERQEE
jgi:hypothetical protein